MLHLSRTRRAAAGSAVVILALLASAEPLSTTLPFDPALGGNCGGPIGAATPLTPTSFIACLNGPDDRPATDDDVAVLFQGVGGAVTTKALPTPFLSSWGPWMTVMSATRCAIPAAGPDGAWNTADDVVYVLDRLGSDDTVTPVTVGFLNWGDGHRPIALDARTFVICTFGPDAAGGNADDRIALVSDVGGANAVTYLAAPSLPSSGKGRPVALSPTSFLVLSDGPAGTDDPQPDHAAYLFTGVGGANKLTTLPTPFLFRWGASVPVRLSATRVVVASAGPDAEEGSADDELLLLDRLGSGNVITHIPVPGIGSDGGGCPLALDDRTVIVTTFGPDGTSKTADDTLVVVGNLGAKKLRRAAIEIGYLGGDAASRAVLLAKGFVGVVSCGPNGSYGSADDRIALVSDVGRKNLVSYIDLPALSEGADGRLVPLVRDAFLVVNGGPDGAIGGGGDGDDRVTLVLDAFGTADLAHFETVGDSRGWRAAHLPRLLGRGRAVFASAGPNGEWRGGDEVFQVLDGLPASRGLEVDRMDILFSAGAPNAPARVSVKGHVRTDGLVPAPTSDVTVTIGNAAQTIPSGALKRNGNVSTYTDKRAARGFVTKLVLDTKKATFSVAGQGVGTGVETTHADYVPVAITYGDVHLSDPCAAASDATGLHFKRAP